MEVLSRRASGVASTGGYQGEETGGRATPSPPRSKCNSTPTQFGVAGEREGVRGRDILGDPFPLTPTLSPTGPKKDAVSLHSDRGGEGVAGGRSPLPLTPATGPFTA